MWFRKLMHKWFGVFKFVEKTDEVEKTDVTSLDNVYRIGELEDGTFIIQEFYINEWHRRGMPFKTERKAKNYLSYIKEFDEEYKRIKSLKVKRVLD